MTPQIEFLARIDPGWRSARRWGNWRGPSGKIEKSGFHSVLTWKSKSAGRPAKTAEIRLFAALRARKVRVGGRCAPRPSSGRKFDFDHFQAPISPDSGSKCAEPVFGKWPNRGVSRPTSTEGGVGVGGAEGSISRLFSRGPKPHQRARFGRGARERPQKRKRARQRRPTALSGPSRFSWVWAHGNRRPKKGCSG